MAGRGLAAQLAALLRQLSGDVSLELGLAASDAAEAASRSAVAWQAADHSNEELAELRSVLDCAPSKLAPVLAKLRQRLAADPIGVAGPAEVAYLGAAMEATSACLCLAPACGASHGAQLQLATAGIGVLVSGGLATLRLCSPQTAQAAHPVMVTAQLPRQLALASYCMAPLVESAAAAEAAVRPQQFVTWLTAVVGALMWLGEDRQTVHLQRELLGSFAYMCHWLLMLPAWSAHAAVTMAQPRLACNMAQLCLSFVSVLAAALPLPPERRPKSCTWGAAASVCHVLTTRLLQIPSFPGAVDASLLSAACAGAAQLVQQFPLGSPPPSVSKQDHPKLVFELIWLLRDTCGPVSVWQRLDSRQQQRLAKQLVPVFSRLPQQLRLAFGIGQVAQLSGLDLDIATAMANSASHVLLAYCSHVQQQQSHSLADILSFCGTACSVLQCLPLLQELGEANRANKSCTNLAVQALALAAFASRAAWLDGSASSANLAAAAAADASLPTALWQLHSHLAQLVHFSAAASNLLARLDPHMEAQLPLVALSHCMGAAAALHHSTHSGVHGVARASTAVPRDVQALCAAHAAAVLAYNAHYPAVQLGGRALETCLAGLIDVAVLGPAAAGLDPALQQLIEQLWTRAVRQDTPAPSAFWLRLLRRAQASPCAALLFASGQQLEEVLQCFEQEPAAVGVEAVIAVIRCVLKAADEAIVAAGGATGSNASSTESASGGDAGDAPLLQQLRTALAAFEAVSPVVSLSAALRNILPAARRLAVALLEWWRRPSAQQQRQLEAAQAAAARSCAYLRCANLGGGGGPAAGQGEGSQRCSACRAVWYCGTACSHADWRAGHRCVCRALGAARVAEKERRRQAAAAAVEAKEQAVA